MKRMKKITALLLALCIVASSFLPNLALHADAAGDAIYVLAGGDFQEAGDHSNSATNVTNILSQISQKYTTMDGFLFIGDYDCETHDSATETANGIATLMDTVDNTYTNLNHANSILVQGNHDYKDSNIDATGGHDFDGYAAYVLNEDDYPNGGGSQTQIQTLAKNLETWLNNKLGEGYDAPIFITSHLPLAFSPRTVTQGDAKYAKLIFDVLNTAADNGLNIIFLYGHDHAYGPDNYMGGEAVYLEEGKSIAIAEPGSQVAYTTETLNFTYMNAGYTGYYSEPGYVTNAGTEKLTMSVFKIENNQVTVERYSADGLYNMKSAGRDGSYSDTSVTASSLGLAIDTAVVPSPQTISLGTVETYGTIGEWVEVASGTGTDDVKPSNKGWVELISPVPGTEAVPGTPASTKYVYTLDTDGTVTDKANAAQGYLIVGSDNANAMTDSLGATSVTIENDAITLTAQPNYEWWITSDGKITDGTRYLRFNNNSVSVITNARQATVWDIAHDENGQYTISYRSSWLRIYYLRNSNNKFSVTTSENTVRLFSGTEVTTPATEGTPATPGTKGTYGKIVGDLTYNATAGMTAEEALALVKAGIDGYYYEAMSTPGSSVTGTKVDDSVLTWEWVDTFDGNTSGDYEVKISYNGIKLGTAEVVVPAATSYYIAEGNGIYYVDMNTTKDAALDVVKAGVAVSSASDMNGTNKQLIDDSEVEWKWVDTYNGADSGPYTVEVLYDGTSLGTVEVKVNVKYESGLNSDWTHVGQIEATGGSYTYTLDTDGIDYGEEHKYIIVDDNEAIVLNANSSSNGTAHSITISNDGQIATLDTRDYEYHMIRTYYNRIRYELVTKGDGSQYLYQENNGVRYGTRSDVKFQLNHHGNGIYDIHDIDGTNWYIIYNSSWTVVTNTSARVRLYKYTGTTGGTPAGDIYAKLEGNTTYIVEQGTSSYQALNVVKAGITGKLSYSSDGLNPTEIADEDLKWTWKNTYKSSITGSYWVDISYKDVVLGTVEVKVQPGIINNYPEYPDEGAVKVNKTATGVDFQASGLAQVELSASGVSVKKGADLIVMLDTSSSMTSHTVTGTSETRASVLETSLTNLITQLKTPGDDGEILDIRVAIADFNGFYGDNQGESGTVYDRDAADMMSDDISYNASSEAKVYTGNGTRTADAFVYVNDLAASYTLNYTSGTNYDYAFETIYQMGESVQQQNADAGEERDLFVIFMSDGAAMQWNYYHSQGASGLWNNWITGKWQESNLTSNLNCTEHSYYYNLQDTDGDGFLNEHRMANAVKGSPNEEFEVIRKNSGHEKNLTKVNGLGATVFSIAFDPQTDTNVTAESMIQSIKSLATNQTSSVQYFYQVTSAEELSNAFTLIGNEVAYAATNARFVDQLGDGFSLQLSTVDYTVGTESKTVTPTIEILEYELYTRQDYLAGNCTKEQIGVRKGGTTLYEVVMFSKDGTKAYSNRIDVDKDGIYGVTVNTDGSYILKDTDDNILGTDGVIYAYTFAYNSSQKSVYLNADSNSATGTDGKEYELQKETFYWRMGTITGAELAMKYYVYLEGSMEGKREAGSYATNNFAILYYDNYLGNQCYKETVSPVFAWEGANVRYAFYLVDENGNIVVNQTTGETGSFANRIAITNPTVYEHILLNNTVQQHVLDVSALETLPEGYRAYDEDATYTITINSNGTGRWEIQRGNEKAVTTYVTGYNGAEYSNALQVDSNAYEYTHTTVWFAVVWEPKAIPDTVVVDFGLPVDISVLVNDMFGDYGKLVAVGESVPTTVIEGETEKPVQYTTTLDERFSESYDGAYGSAQVMNVDEKVNAKVRYTLNTTEINDKESFAYAVNYTGTSNSGYYYGDINVIPATSVYYEDGFVEFAGKTKDESGSYVSNEQVWKSVGIYENAIQAEDRPGTFSLSAVDKNNLYGYDQAYDSTSMSTYSMGSAMMAHIKPGTIGTASFDFWGTGFDIISLTSNKTGVLVVQVSDYDSNKLLKNYIVDTYYGYVRTQAKDEDGNLKVDKEGNPVYEWVVATSDTTGTVDNALYQIPVMKIKELKYGHYKVKITASHSKTFDHTEEEGYDLYIDAIRIFDPAGNEKASITDIYGLDKEARPAYYEIRNQIIEAGAFGTVEDNTSTEGSEAIQGAVFVDGAGVNAEVSDYADFGPNNELYLAAGQAVVFNLQLPNPESIADVQIGIKSANGIATNCLIYNVDVDGIAYNTKGKTLYSCADMYYSIYDLKNNTIVVMNDGTGAGIISLTNVKITYTLDTDEVLEASMFYVTPNTVTYALRSMNYAPPTVETPEEDEDIVSGVENDVANNNQTASEGVAVNGILNPENIATNDSTNEESAVTMNVAQDKENQTVTSANENASSNDIVQNDVDNQNEMEEIVDEADIESDKAEKEKSIWVIIWDMLEKFFVWLKEMISKLF